MRLVHERVVEQAERQRLQRRLFDYKRIASVTSVDGYRPGYAGHDCVHVLVELLLESLGWEILAKFYLLGHFLNRYQVIILYKE